MITKKLRLLTLLLAAVVMGLTPFVPAKAAESAQSNGLGISPRRDFTIKAGESIDDTLYIRNLSLTQNLQVQMSIVDFGAKDETGVPEIKVEENAPQTAWSLKPYMTIQGEIQIEAGKSANVPVKITIPAEQGAGSYYSAVRYIAINPETKQKVNIAASSASLIFVTVPGQANESIKLKQFGSWLSTNEDGTNGVFKKLFITQAPKEFAYRIQNDGNVAESVNGTILVKNAFGKTVKEIKDANPKKQLSLIGQVRRIQVCIKDEVLKNQESDDSAQKSCANPGLWPGRYTAELSLFYGINGSSTQDIQAKASFWYLPLWFLISVSVLLLLIFLLVWLGRRAFTNGKRYRK